MKENKLTIHLTRVTTFKTLYSMIIAVLPLIAHFIVPFWGIGFATLLIGVTVPYPFMCILRGRKFKNALPVILLIAFLLLRSTGSIRSAFLLLMVIIHALGAFNDSLDFSVFKRTIIFVALLSAVAVIFQSILFYVFRIRSSLLIRGLLLADNRYYVSKLRNGTGLYRPSAFFLEPSHYAQYCSVGLSLLLFSNGEEENNRRKALLTTIGILLTTSGMGLIFCLGLWGWYIVFQRRKEGRKMIYIFFGLIALAVVGGALLLVPFIRDAVNRIFIGDQYGHTAIWGRTLYWGRYIGSMSLKSQIIGYGRRSLPDVYMTSLMSTIYQEGYIGVALYALTFLRFMFRGRDNITLTSGIIYLSLFCFAGMTGFIRLIFWFCLMELEASDAVRLHNEVISDES